MRKLLWTDGIIMFTMQEAYHNIIIHFVIMFPQVDAFRMALRTAAGFNLSGMSWIFICAFNRPSHG